MFIVGTKKSETSINLAKHLKNCEGGYEIPQEQLDKKRFIVNYGRSSMSAFAHLNKNLISNKLQQLKILRSNGLHVPDFVELPIVEKDSYFKRIQRNLFPLIARKYRHSKGTDAVFLKTKGSLLKRKHRIKKRDYLVKYVPKLTEFRVHVLGNTIAGISTKIKCEEDTKHHPHIWSRLRGWIQVDYTGTYYEKLKEIGIQSIKALGYDFGAVDVMLGLNGSLYVLEVNSSPRLNMRRRRLYAKYFRQKEREYRERIRNEEQES